MRVEVNEPVFKYTLKVNLCVILLSIIISTKWSQIESQQEPNVIDECHNRNSIETQMLGYFEIVHQNVTANQVQICVCLISIR